MPWPRVSVKEVEIKSVKSMATDAGRMRNETGGVAMRFIGKK